MHAALVRFAVNRKMGTPGMTKQRLIKIILVIEIVLLIALVWVSIK
jgi:flagellar basal body-associated protein FliL